MDKKKEEEILTKIFSKMEYDISESEEPDFLLSKKDTEQIFGVEVTEIFRTESDARILNIPGYFNNIIDNGKYYNKIDIKTLPVKKAKVYPSGMDEDSKEIKCIIRDIASRDEVADIIKNAIIKKNKKITNYQKKVDNNYLIIFDNEHFINSKDNLYACAFNIELIETIVNSRFKAIHFLTRVENDVIYYELKSACFIFLAFLTLAFAKCFKIDNPDKFYLTLSLLSDLGFELKKFFSDEEDCIKVKCCNSIVCFTEKEDELIIDKAFTETQSSKDEDFQDFAWNKSEFCSVKDKYIEFLLSKDIRINLSKKAF